MPPQDAKVFATTQLDRLLAFFPRVDGKASFVLALNVALLGVMAVNFPIRHIGSPRACAGIIAALLLILSFWQLCVVFFPDLKSGEKRSLIYFGDIASLGWRGYHKALKDASEDDLLEDRSGPTPASAQRRHRNAAQAHPRFRNLLGRGSADRQGDPDSLRV